MTLATLKLQDSMGAPHATALAIGPWERGEFAIARAQLGDTSRWEFIEDSDTAIELLHRNKLMPEFVLLAQPLPGRYQQAEIETLRRLAPLAQIVVVVGTWCEGELRTGKPFTGVLRLYWHELPTWWQAQEGTLASWAPCLDGAISPRYQESKRKVGGVIAIHSPTLASYEALAAAIVPASCHWVCDSLVSTARIGIWDGGQLDPAEWSRLQAFVARVHQHGGSAVVLLDFPRKELFARLHEIGCEAVLGKPYVVGELISVIHRLQFGNNHSPVF